MRIQGVLFSSAACFSLHTGTYQHFKLHKLEKRGTFSVVSARFMPYTVALGDSVSKPRDVRYIGLNVYLIRKNILRVSQEEFAYMVNMSKDTVSNIERGICIPTVHHLISIANCANVPVDILLCKPEESLCATHTK